MFQQKCDLTLFTVGRETYSELSAVLTREEKSRPEGSDPILSQLPSSLANYLITKANDSKVIFNSPAERNQSEAMLHVGAASFIAKVQKPIASTEWERKKKVATRISEEIV